MKINYKKIINIKTKKDLLSFPLDKPLFGNNYLFHYLIEINNLVGIKLHRYPIYLENNDNLNGFALAAYHNHIDILEYLIENYPEYIYNRNNLRNTFAYYLSFDSFPMLLTKYPKLDWEDLITNGTNKPNIILKNIITNLKYDNLKDFIKHYNININENNQYLFGIINNAFLSSEEKIKILNSYSNEEINIKNRNGKGLILAAIETDDYKLFNYLLNRNIDIDYYTLIKTENPLIFSVYADILSNELKYSKLLLDKLIKINPTFYEHKDKSLNNIAHSILLFRMSRNKFINSKIDYSMDIEILKHCSSDCWNELNINKVSPIELVSHLSYSIYSPLFKNIKISKNILSKIKDKDWFKLFEKLPSYEYPKDDIKLEDNEYSHSTLFQAKFVDVGLFVLYLVNKYPDLELPNMKSYLIKNLTFEDNLPFSDDIISKEPIFPWIISFYSPDNYHIHSYLNNIINTQRRIGKKRFGFIFLSLKTDTLLHANILIYDLKKMTIERFEPYGNTSNYENYIDDILEEELTWNTGLTYLRPSDYLPFSSFQTISDENNIINMKAGDFGGFCLAWCLWYLENRLTNPNIEQKLLVNKLINKINKSELKFNEVIRNYANKINKYRITYLKQIGLDNKSVSNLYFDNKEGKLLTNYLIRTFTGSLKD